MIKSTVANVLMGLVDSNKKTLTDEELTKAINMVEEYYNNLHKKEVTDSEFNKATSIAGEAFK